MRARFLIAKYYPINGMPCNTPDPRINREQFTLHVTEADIPLQSYQGPELAQANGGFSAGPDSLKNSEFLTSVNRHRLIVVRVQEPSRIPAVLRSSHSIPTLPKGNALRSLRPKADKTVGTRPRLSGSRSCAHV